LAAAADVQQERERLHRNWQQQVERAGYQAERARRQHDAAEPENRLVVRELERRWEEALQEQRRVEEEYARFSRNQPAGLSADDREQIRALAQDLPALWQAAATTAADRQRIIRLLVEQVRVTLRDQSEWVDVTIHWAGGWSSAHAVVRPVRGYQQLADYEKLYNRIDELSKGGYTLTAVAEQMNREGFRTPKRASRFTPGMVAHVLALGRPGERARAGVERELLREHEWLLPDLARNLDMPATTLHRWIRVGWVHARKLPTAGGPWVIWADADELDRMTRIRTSSRSSWQEPISVELTKPKVLDRS
jgi:hypothetical protein